MLESVRGRRRGTINKSWTRKVWARTSCLGWKYFVRVIVQAHTARARKGTKYLRIVWYFASGAGTWMKAVHAQRGKS